MLLIKMKRKLKINTSFWLDKTINVIKYNNYLLNYIWYDNVLKIYSTGYNNKIYKFKSLDDGKRFICKVFRTYINNME